MTIGEYLRKEGYSEQFSNDFLLARPRFSFTSSDHQADGPTLADQRRRLGYRARQVIQRIPGSHPGPVHEQSQPAASCRCSGLVDDRGRQVRTV